MITELLLDYNVVLLCHLDGGIYGKIGVNPQKIARKRFMIDIDTLISVVLPCKTLPKSDNRKLVKMA